MSNLPRIIIDAVLFCPHCGARHVDESRGGEKWHRRAHTTHRCQTCGGDFDVYASGQAPDAPAPPLAKVPDCINTVPTWLTEHLRVIQEDAFNMYNIDPNFVITCSVEFGLRIGIAPGGVVMIAGSCGPTYIKSEPRQVEVNNK